MAVRPLVNLERLTTAHVNSVDGSMTYESGVEYKANTTVSYNGSLYTANVDIEDTDTDTPDVAPEKWSMTINAPDSGTSGDISALAARVTALEDTVGDDTDGLVKDVDDLQNDVGEISENIRELGALNLCNCTNPGTVLDVTLTITRNDDSTYTLNGTVAEDKSVVLTDTFTVEEGVYYTISGGLNNDSDTTQKLWVTSDAFPLGNRLQTDIGMNNFTAQASTTATATLSLIVKAGSTYDNAIIKPMVVIGKHNYNYVPYAMSNRELTDILDYKKLANSNYGATVADTWEYSGISVTLDKPALIAVNYSYDNTSTKGIAVCTGTASVTTAKMSIEDSVEGSHQLVGILPTGTYYVWVKASGVSSNNIKVYKLMTLESNPF